MKPKKIPKTVIAWLILMGFWGGSVGGFAATALWLTFDILAIYIWMAITTTAIGLWGFIGYRYNRILVEYGIVEQKKRQK